MGAPKKRNTLTLIHYFQHISLSRLLSFLSPHPSNARAAVGVGAGFMNLNAALASQLGTPIKEFTGRYTWKPSPPCGSCACEATLVATDRDTFAWTDVVGCGGISCNLCVHPSHTRDATNAHWFIGDGASRTCYPACAPCCTDAGTVWVLGKPTEPPKLFVSIDDANKGTAAPMLLAMRRDRVPTESTGTRAPMSKPRVGGVDGAVRQAGEQRKLITDRDIANAKKAEAKEAEKAAIAEAIENARRKDERREKRRANLAA